ncbi:MAG: 30S ribosomal protein S12 methylthiotransferase RimO, partial [Chlamydiales bacterium]
MLGILLKSGYEITPHLEEADYLVVNTCAFLESSRIESKEVIAELLDCKKESAKLIVTGCMVTKHREEIETLFPGVHYLLGSGDVEGILRAVQSDQQGREVGTTKSYLEAGEVPRMLSTPTSYAYLKIAEGCRKGCAYCIIPQIKGKLRSKTFEQVLKEFRALLSQGVKEIILIAQDLGDYGKDRGEFSLAPLLKNILSIKGDYWLRLLYLYPDEITDEIIEIIQSDPRICPYLDMPIQHINDEILKDMRRHTDGKQIKHVIRNLREKIPAIHIRTSLIVGFPGESEKQFQELASFLQEFPLNQVGIFKYSREEGTPAAKMDNQIDEGTKERRHQELAKIQQQAVETLNQNLIGQKLDVIVESYHPESEFLLVGRHQGQCPDIDGQVILNDWSRV